LLSLANVGERLAVDLKGVKLGGPSVIVPEERMLCVFLTPDQVLQLIE
jgi:hypothetical protein